MDMCVRVRRGLVLAGLLLGVGFVGLPAGAAYAAPPAEAGASVNSIVVQGNRRVEAETVRSYFKAGPGERLDAAKIDAALKALYASGLFDDVHITQSGGHIIVTVVESPVINRLAFEGNHRMKDEQLQEEIQSKARNSLSRPRVQADTQRIVEVYHRNGRFDVTVAPQIIERPNNRVDLVFVVNEGEKTGVKSIDFVGNKAYSSWRLKEVIKTAQSNFLSFLQTTDVYDPDRMEADRDLIRRFYLKHGFADVQVVSAVAEYDPAKKGFNITFTIEEGPLYHFGAADVQSNVRAINSQSLRPVLRMRQGDIYNGEAIEKTVEEVTIEVARRGYPFATVRPRGDRNPQTRTINVAFVVDEGTRAYIERINIHGNIRTRDYVIRREFDIAEGDPYNRALIDRAERRLKNLNFFKSVKITNEPGSAPDRVVINVELEEQSTGDFSIMGGYSTAEGWLAQMSVSERNLLGTGRYAKIALTYGEFVRGAEFSFVEPYFLDQRLAAGIDLFAKETLANSYLSYGTESYGGSFKLGIALREDLALQLRYSIYTQRITLPSYLNDCNNLNPDFCQHLPDADSHAAAGPDRSAISRLQSSGSGQLLYLRPGLAAGAGRACHRRHADVARGIRTDLQHARQQQEPDQRPVAHVRSGFRRSRRRRRLYAHEHRLPHLLRSRSRPDRHLASASRQHDRARRPGSPPARRLQDGPEPGARLCAGRPRPARHHVGNGERRHRRHQLLGREPRVPISVLLPAQGHRLPRRRVRRCRLGVGLQGRDAVAATGEINGVIKVPTSSTPSRTGPGSFVCQCGMQYADSAVRAHVGRRQHHLGFAVRPAAFRFCLSDFEGELRPDPILRLRRRNALLSVA